MLKSAWFSTTAVLVVGLVLGLSTLTVTAQRADKGDKHPHMQAALRQLNEVGGQLEKAAHDYGGHRSKALQLVKQAAQEIKEGLAFAEKEATPKAGPKK